ncbi:MAG: phosphate acyltransferase PlsX [Myxococcales bacterium]|nr:phosphate acyltransferase PlsX [Myxococcales bacterium]
MGADGGVRPLVEGAAQLSMERGETVVVLVGDDRAIRKTLASVAHDAQRIEVVHAPSAVLSTDNPAEALALMPDASILHAAKLVLSAEADVLVSAGNTGAVILAAARTFTRLPGVRRSALAAVIPTLATHGPHKDPFALMLDVGATLECSADELVGFAVMGSAYSRVVSEIARPRVGLLSNGTEPRKGTPAVVEAHAMLARSAAVDFAGNIEGLDIPRGSVDVVVCDGFVGNIVLKMFEGVADAAKTLAKDAYAARLRYKLGLMLLSQGLRRVRELTDWQAYGGAPILGFDRLVIKAHGRSNARAVRNALRVATKTVERALVPKIEEGLRAAADLR